jgi:N-acetylmuramoyl-L-alanine amidase
VQTPSTDPVECLARNVYYEAQGESFDGKVAVAQVTVNRAITVTRICETVYFKRIDPATGHKVAAFSWTLGAAWRAKGPINPRIYAECEIIARAVLAGDLHGKIGNNVTYYHTAAVNPAWHKKFVAKIGHHLFYAETYAMLQSH